MQLSDKKTFHKYVKYLPYLTPPPHRANQGLGGTEGHRKFYLDV